MALQRLKRHLSLFLGVSMVSLTCICAQNTKLSVDLDTLWESRHAAVAVFRESRISECSLVFVTDKTVHSDSLYWMSENTDIISSYSVYEMSSKSVSAIDPFSFINKIRQSSRCIMLITVTDDLDVISFIVEGVVSRNVLIWPTRHLIITSLPIRNLRVLRKYLSISNSMVMEFTKNSHRCGVYAYLPYSQRVIITATWTKTGGLTVHVNQKLFPDKFSKLKDGAHLTVVGNNFPPHIVIREIPKAEGEKKEFMFSGPVVMLLEILAAKMNFTYSLVQPSDGSWGFLFPNGTWNGLIGMLLRKEVDFALGPLGITYLRSRVVDYTNSLVVDYGKILGRRGNSEVDPWGFLMPLTPSIWAATFGSLFFILALTVGITHLDRNVVAPLSKMSPVTHIRVFLQQDIVVPPNSRWEKILLGSWLLGTLILLECYSTNLITLLAVRHIKEPFQSVRDVIDEPGVKMLWVAHTAYAQYLSAVEEGIFHEVAEAGKHGKNKFFPGPQLLSIVDELVSRGDHVLVTPFIIMKVFLTEDYMDKGRCKYYVSKEQFLPLTFCMAVPKYSPLRGPVNDGIRAVVEGGIYNYWLENAFVNSKSCKNPPTKITVMTSLSLSNLWGMFVILVGGYIVSFVALCLEMSVKKIHTDPRP